MENQEEMIAIDPCVGILNLQKLQKGLIKLTNLDTQIHVLIHHNLLYTYGKSQSTVFCGSNTFRRTQ